MKTLMADVEKRVKLESDKQTDYFNEKLGML